ncbi:MAG: TetR/AcrR family transcriptional regulator [Nitrospirae bacterium]|nr:TetR/AcrR family transcriptional regulator [Nitrospirota bacterium]
MDVEPRSPQIPPPEPHGRPETRQELLKGAIEVFASKGYADTQVRDIVRACRCGIGTFYQYFRNKDEIFLEILHAGAHLLQQRVSTRAAEKQGLPSAIEAGMRAFFDFVDGNRPYFIVLFREGSVPRPAIRAVVNQAVGGMALVLRDLLRRGIEGGRVRPLKEDELEVIVHGVIGACMHLADLMVHGFAVPKEEMILHATRALVEGIAKEVNSEQ